MDFDVVVLGTGSGGKLAASELAGQGLRVLALDPGRFGGDCPYVACVPSKALLLAARAGLGWDEAVRRRDEVTDGRDDSGSREAMEKAGVVTARAAGVLAPGEDGAHRVLLIERTAGDAPQVDDSVTARWVVLAPGSEATIPPLDGLDSVPYWTSDDALSTDRQPASMIILGGGAIGCELSQAFAGLGTRVQLVEVSERLLGKESGWVGPLLAEQLAADGVDIHVGVEPTHVTHDGRGFVLELEDSTVLTAEALLVAGGRTGRGGRVGLDAVGVEPDGHGQVAVDRRCRVLGVDGTPIDGLYAIGDVTPDSAYTHSANHQAYVVAADISGRGFDADYSGDPRVVYTEPPVFCVGLTPDQAAGDALDTIRLGVDLADVERGGLVEACSIPDGSVPVRGRVELLVDRQAEVVVGAACVGPAADSWGAELALAIRARVPLSTLRRHIRAFPTWSEAVTAALLGD